jgi:ribosome modulation factor
VPFRDTEIHRVWLEGQMVKNSPSAIRAEEKGRAAGSFTGKRHTRNRTPCPVKEGWLRTQWEWGFRRGRQG